MDKQILDVTHLWEECKRLKQEIKSLYKEKNCLHKIIDRLLENSGYSKDIASAEDFEDVYEDMQIKRNELIELKQALEEIKQICDWRNEYNSIGIDDYNKIIKDVESKINEVLGND